MKLHVAAVVCIASLLACKSGYADCSKAEDLASRASSWAELNRLFVEYSKCDDGLVAEGFSDSVTTLLDKKWENLTESQYLFEDQYFVVFVLKHIDESAPDDRLARIAKQASGRCVFQTTDICILIQRLAESAVARAIKYK